MWDKRHIKCTSGPQPLLGQRPAFLSRKITIPITKGIILLTRELYHHSFFPLSSTFPTITVISVYLQDLKFVLFECTHQHTSVDLNLPCIDLYLPWNIHKDLKLKKKKKKFGNTYCKILSIVKKRISSSYVFLKFISFFHFSST